MTEKRGRPPVPSSKGREWLKKMESGITFGEIGKKEGYDPRTVKKHVMEAQCEREAHQARTLVLRNALDKHYQDLVDRAIQIEKSVLSGKEIDLEFTDPYMWKALKQHIPGNSFWANINDWNQFLKDIETLRQDAQAKIRAYFRKEAGSVKVFSSEAVLEGTIAIYQRQFDQWSTGGRGLDIVTSFRTEQIDDRHSRLICGSSNIERVENDRIHEIEEAIIKYEAKVKRWEILTQVQDLYDKLQNDIKPKILDETAIIKFKRVIAGHCDYCPA